MYPRSGLPGRILWSGDFSKQSRFLLFRRICIRRDFYLILFGRLWPLPFIFQVKFIFYFLYFTTSEHLMAFVIFRWIQSAAYNVILFCFFCEQFFSCRYISVFLKVKFVKIFFFFKCIKFLNDLTKKTACSVKSIIQGGLRLKWYFQCFQFIPCLFSIRFIHMRIHEFNVLWHAHFHDFFAFVYLFVFSVVDFSFKLNKFFYGLY